MEKIIIVVRGGMVEDVFARRPNQYNIEIIDLDTDVPEELEEAEERLKVVEDCYARQEV